MSAAHLPLSLQSIHARVEAIHERILYAPLNVTDRDLLMETRAALQKLAGEIAVATQNIHAARSRFGDLPETTVEWCGSAKAYAVRCNGEIIEWFGARHQAEAFANQYDQLHLIEKTKRNEKAQAQ